MHSMVCCRVRQIRALSMAGILKKSQAPATMGPDPFKEVQLPLMEKFEINHDTKRFRFKLENGHRLGLPVGNHISARSTFNGNMVQRSYTPVSSDDDLGYTDLVIKVYYPNEKFPDGGVMSQHIDNLNIGEKLTFVGPKGRIKYHRNGNFTIATPSGENSVSGVKNICMIAGGSGITPMMQIARDSFKGDDEAKIYLLFANKTPDDILLREEIEKAAADHKSKFTFMFTVDSAKPGEEWSHKTGFITQEMISEFFPPAGDETLTLICGPPGMIEYACLPNLAKLGHKDDHIFVY